jgi:hypothetical protein
VQVLCLKNAAFSHWPFRYTFTQPLTRLEAEYAEREAAIHARLDSLSGQVTGLSGQIEHLTRQLDAFTQ